MSKNKYPILLAHGIARFDFLQEMLTRLPGIGEVLGDRFHYFKGIKSFLEAHGFEARHTSVDFAGSVKRRAEQLARQVERAGKVHIVAHSMGGLDARYMVVNIAGMAEKVATITTIGTPHHGTVFADRGLTPERRRLIDALKPVLHLEGFEDLTTEACRKFNADSLEREAGNSVVYQTYASAQERAAVFLPLQVSHEIIEKVEGANDGLVSLTSQAWVPELAGKKTIAQKRFPFPADHLNEVGWSDASEGPREAFEAKVKAVYLEIAEGLLKHER